MLTLRTGLISTAACLFATNPAAARSHKSPPQNGGCTLAIVARSLSSQGKVCDENTVREMAGSGHVFEQNQMGMASILAIGPDYSIKEAVKWFEKAALNGYAPAQVNLAVMYGNGWGRANNYGAALRWLRAAADQHYPPAYYNLGLLYLQGKGVKRDYAEALKLFRKGAEAGDTNAQTNLGYMYDQGLGLAKDLAAAAEWYRKGATGGNPMAQHNLADMYLRGEGVLQDDDAAFRLFTQAARQGYTGAEIKLGYMYANGRGTSADLEVAYEWLTAASLAGDKRGEDIQQSIQTKLGREQIVRATERARRLQPPQASLQIKSLLP